MNDFLPFSEMAEAARLLSGPAEMVLTRTLYFWPASHASTRVSDSSADLAELIPPPRAVGIIWVRDVPWAGGAGRQGQGRCVSATCERGV